MEPDKRMGLHWFLSHISSFLGILVGIANIINQLKQASTIPFNILIIFDLAFVVAMMCASIIVFSHRNEYSVTVYKGMLAIIFIPALNYLYALIVASIYGLDTYEYIIKLIAQLIISGLLFWYYRARKHIFSGGYVYNNGVGGDLSTSNIDVDNKSSTNLIENEDSPTLSNTDINATYSDNSHNKILFCRKCGTKLNPDSNFCLACGTRICFNDEQPQTAHIQTIEKEPILYCHKCGFKLLDSSEYCSKCGTRIIK